MLLSYLKLSLRLLMRNPFFTGINVAGLSVGFAVFFVPWQYSQSELRSDQFHKDWERIVRFGMIARHTDDKVNWKETKIGSNDAEFTRLISQEYTEIESFTRILNQKHFHKRFTTQEHDSDIFFSSMRAEQSESFLETRIAYADPNLFSFFTIPMIMGSPKNCLDIAWSVVLSKEKARKYFGDENPMGKMILLNGKIVLTVTGVFEDLPLNTHLDFDIVISSESIKNTFGKISQTWFAPHCYFKLKVNTDSEDLAVRINKDLKDLIKRVVFGDWPYGFGEIYFQPLADIPFTSFFRDFYGTKARTILTIFEYSAIVILLLAWINYVNLSISSNHKRLQEIAARKTFGARPVDFIFQFIIESLLINVFSLLLAVTIIQLIKSPIWLFFQFYIPDWKDIPSAVILVASFVLSAGILLTGVYPALITIKHNCTKAKSLQEKTSVNTVLTTFQFSVAVILIVWIFIIYDQINFILNKDIGLDKEQVLVLDLPFNRSEEFKTGLNTLVNRIESIRSIGGVTVSGSVPGDDLEHHIALRWKKDDAGLSVVSNGGVDENFIPFYDIKLVAGRNFLPDHPSDSSSVILSEVTAVRLGFKTPALALSQKIIIADEREAEVIGIIKDYKIRPLLNNGDVGGGGGTALTYKDFVSLLASFSIPRKISMHIKPDQLHNTISAMKEAYSEEFPGEVFNWYFLDQIINGKYKQHQIANHQITLFTCIAIGIACLGLLGMISNKVVEKTKEIGIRKVLGAELYQIAQILLNTTVKQIIVATIIGIPVAYYLTQQYLEKFSERITLQWWHFALPVLILVVIMFVTVASVLWKAARSNPVEALKYE